MAFLHHGQQGVSLQKSLPNFSVPQNPLEGLLKHRLMTLPPEFLIQQVWVGPNNLHVYKFPGDADDARW